MSEVTKRKLLKDIDITTMYRMREHGMSNPEIAERLGVSAVTVWNHIGKQPPKKELERLKEEHAPKPVSAVDRFNDRLAKTEEIRKRRTTPLMIEQPPTMEDATQNTTEAMQPLPPAEPLKQPQKLEKCGYKPVPTHIIDVYELGDRCKVTVHDGEVSICATRLDRAQLFDLTKLLMYLSNKPKGGDELG